MKYEMDHSRKIPKMSIGKCPNVSHHPTGIGQLQIRFQVIFKIPTGHWPTPVVTALRRPCSYGVVSTSFNGSKRLQFAIETGHLVDLPIKNWDFP